jgi:hypothetical protein
MCMKSSRSKSSCLEGPWLRGYSLVLFASAAMNGAAIASPDCSGYNPNPGQFGYQARSNSERCEGQYIADASGGGIDLVSLTFGRIRFGSAPCPSSRARAIGFGELPRRLQTRRCQPIVYAGRCFCLSRLAQQLVSANPWG